MVTSILYAKQQQQQQQQQRKTKSLRLVVLLRGAFQYFRSATEYEIRFFPNL